MQRLASPEAFRDVFEKGIRCHLALGLYLIKPNAHSFARLGLVIAKKKLRHSVNRHYLKRIQRESFRQAQFLFAGYDIVFVANHKSTQLCRRDIFTACQADWRSLIKRLPKS